MPTITTPSFQLAVYKRGDAKAKKLALLLPGRLDMKDYLHMRSHVDFLAGKGYLALSFDPPGTWESPGKIEIYTMTNYLKAINELIAHFGSKPTVLMGHSRGGTMAMLAGTHNSHVTHIIMAMSSPRPSSVGTERRTKDGFVISYRDTPSDGKKKFELPWSYFEDASQYDLAVAMASCTKPKLFFLGKKDVLVPPEIVRDGFERSAEPKELYEVDSDHDYRRHPGIIDEINGVVGKFLEKKF